MPGPLHNLRVAERLGLGPSDCWATGALDVIGRAEGPPGITDIDDLIAHGAAVQESEQS